MKTASNEITVRGITVQIQVLHESDGRWSWQFSAANGVKGSNAHGEFAITEVHAFDQALDAAYRAVFNSGA